MQPRSSIIGVVEALAQEANHQSSEYADESDQVGYPIPSAPLIEGAGAGGDRHILVVDKDACRL